MSNIVAIIGRPNVGKSTLFNRLTESRQAIVDSISGVTRDRHYGKAEWNGREFTVIDTGGYITGSDDVFEVEIRKQVQIAIDEANLLIFVVDSFDGVTRFDKDVAVLVRKSGKKCFLVVNKIDTPDKTPFASEFYSLGLGEVYPVSAASGGGTGDLLDEVIKALPNPEDDLEEKLPRIAIVGRPNVGKSSLTNALLGNERNIVTPVPGTTRDAINTRYNAFGNDFWLIDTAGIRKKAKVHEDLEFYSVMRSIRAIESCDVVLMMIDATTGLEAQDLSIFDLAVKNHKGVVILVNKWDLIDKDTNSAKKIEAEMKEKLAPFNDVPILFVSVLEKQRILKAIEVAIQVYNNRRQIIPTRKLNEFFEPVLSGYPPPALKGKYVKIKYVTQMKGIPMFIFFCNLPQYVSESYKRYLENKLREHFDFTGVPIEIVMRKK
ncbi:MAG TPA: ribosome biogenesis GTPase Der [Bacteroidia bacterium]